ncbi:MAG: methylated-DNA--[protein]-cysteine S-methyltransferase [Deltaproteobacteria bacterium]|nr:methylated-DNA--[protein]-cysteine S-methyltransferase [Deltaproteobacteria bacterium]
MGVKLATAVVETPIGALRLAVSEAGVARIGLPRSSGPGFAGWLRSSFADAERVPWLPLLDKLSQELIEYFGGRRREFEVPLDLHGTEFQLSVWREIAAIPYGEMRTYGGIADAAGRPRAVRAVGTATGNNPVPILVPCHRVIAAQGRLGGFSGGLDVKRRLLALERASTGVLL